MVTSLFPMDICRQAASYMWVTGVWPMRAQVTGAVGYVKYLLLKDDLLVYTHENHNILEIPTHLCMFNSNSICSRYRHQPK